MVRHHGHHAGGRRDVSNSFQHKLSEKIRKNMHEWHAGRLKAGAGHHPAPSSMRQVIAISASQVRKGKT